MNKPLKKINLNIYLLKKGEGSLPLTEKEFLAKTASDSGRVRRVSTVKHELGANGDLGVLYVKHPQSSGEPGWVDFLKHT